MPNPSVSSPIDLREKFELFSDHWHPRIIGELNGQQVKLAKIQGEFIWHSHPEEDELFFVIKGELQLDFRDRTVRLQPGQMIIVPRGVEHRPRAAQEVHLMLFEPASTRNTGDARSSELTRDELEWI